MSRLGRASNVTLVVDVDSHAIRALAFESSKQGDLRIMRKTEEKIRTASGGFRTAAKTKEIIFSLLKFLEYTPRQILVGLGPSIAAQTMANIPCASEEKANNQEQIFTDSLKKEENSGRKIIAADPLLFEIDGYPAPEHTHGGERLSVKTCLAFLSAEQYAAFFEITRIAERIPVQFVPSISVTAEAVIHAQGADRALIVKVNDAETVLMAGAGGHLADFAVFPVGAVHFAHRIAAGHALTREEAHDTIRQIAFGIGFSGEEQRFTEEIKAVFDMWQAKFLRALASLYIYGPFSGQIFLTGEGAYVLPIRSYLGSADWLRDVSYAEHPRLRVLDAPALFGGETFEGALSAVEDTGLASLVYRVLFHKPFFGYTIKDNPF